MKIRAVSGIMLILLLTGTVTLMFTGRASTEAIYDQAGPKTDVLRGVVIGSRTHRTQTLDARLHAIQTDVADVLSDLERTSDIEELASDGFTVTSDMGFHMGYIAYNIRRYQSYRRGDLALGFWPLADVDFRHALIHGYDQLRIVSTIYGYTVTPIRSLVPPAQSYWYNPAVPEHAFNIGDPFTSPPGEHSTVGILKAAGYTYVDADSSRTVTDVDYWNDPNGNPLPRMLIWTPLESVAPTSWEHGQQFVNDLGTIGLKATTANGNSGMVAEGADFNWYLTQVFDYHDFDGYMVFWGLGRFPDQMYLLTHSCFMWWCGYNAPGIRDRELDALLETMMFTLPPSLGQPDVRREAAFEAQRRLYDPSYDYALAYMMLYSRTYFNAFDQNLRGIIRSPGYGSDNKWTWLNAHWAQGTERLDPDGNTVVNYILGGEPDLFNPTHASTKFEWFYIGKVVDSLMAINPYNHKDIPWIATDWELVETGIPATPMEITYTLRDDVEWQDGRPFTASDAAFNLNFLKDHAIPRYSSIWQFIDNVVANDVARTLTVTATDTNWVLLYDFAGISALLPPQIWDRPWTDLQEILNYDPTEPYNVAPGYVSGFTPPPTNLFGTGPWIFQFYDDVNLYGDLLRNEAYFMTTMDVYNLLTEMFHEVGDVNRDGLVWGIDYYRISMSFGHFEGEDEYDEDADLNQDGFVDIMDMATVAHSLGRQKEYP